MPPGAASPCLAPLGHIGPNQGTGSSTSEALYSTSPHVAPGPGAPSANLQNTLILVRLFGLTNKTCLHSSPHLLPLDQVSST